jgi:multidrug efflux pump subunit AcrA (membrane-fusion protein)
MVSTPPSPADFFNITCRHSISGRFESTRMTERRVNVGDTVKPGQLIASLDPQNEQSSLQGARAQFVAANAQQIEARSSYARLRDLGVKKAVSQAQYEPT